VVFSEGETDRPWFFTFFQVSIQRGMATRVPNMHQLTKTKMGTGCWLEMFHGSKFSLTLDLNLVRILIKIIKLIHFYWL
jgi:hypothetical protein